MEVRNIYHLYSRAGFGITIADAHTLSKQTTAEVVDALLAVDGKQTYLNLVRRSEIPTRAAMKNLTKEEKKDLKDVARTKIKKLNTGWIKQMVSTQTPLLEKTTLFWHGHFACRIDNPYTTQQLNNIECKYAFAPFKDLLMAVSKSAAMLQF